ncbi:alkaline phosphatase [Chelatococcus reniformis]|uniref:Alkaline phosphatase n=1 Tax=Chelatococcus reniformis TaxID=1494448 RepID=A0A916XDH5_9HYPH|nr:alkaline phosphatase [Chelatococcus reniformis]GGC63811.1 alkaline phosphatase [Chelatococcus reniformis]
MRGLIAVLTVTTCLASAAEAATIYPLDRADILVRSPFDLKVEFDKVVKPDDVKVTINGKPAAEVLGRDLEFIEKEDGVDASAVRLRAAHIAQPGAYTVGATAAGDTKTVTWNVYATQATPKAKNVIFFLGDGMSVAHRTAARLMSKGMTEGKANGRLHMDDLDRMAFIGTSATNSISTDSANSMSAYMTGHKTAVNALGVYADRTKSSLDDPRVETVAEALRRLSKKSIGIVSGAEIEDATPAAVIAHTRLRSDKPDIATQFLDTKPEIILGGGSAYFLPKSTPGSKRKDDKDLIKAFRDDGYALATDKAELAAASGTNTGKILGLFHTGNMDTVLDREFLKKGTVPRFPNQPGLVDMTKVALDQLSKNPDGFFLMVEGALIDKQSHPMDWERALFDTIEFDKAVGLGLEFARKNPDTLVIVTSDHTHGVSLIGTIDDAKPGTDMREKIGVYAAAGFPNYEDKDGDGYPDRIDVSRRLAMFAADFPDYYETFRPKLDGPFEPTVPKGKQEFVANEAYRDVPGAVLRIGNLPREADSAVHAVDDVILQATGPGSDAFKGYMEESDVYRAMVDALALAPPRD